jgi:hypothetical protein
MREAPLVLFWTENIEHRIRLTELAERKPHVELGQKKILFLKNKQIGGVDIFLLFLLGKESWIRSNDGTIWTDTLPKHLSFFFLHLIERNKLIYINCVTEMTAALQPVLSWHCGYTAHIWAGTAVGSVLHLCHCQCWMHSYYYLLSTDTVKANGQTRSNWIQTQSMHKARNYACKRSIE